MSQERHIPELEEHDSQAVRILILRCLTKEHTEMGRFTLETEKGSLEPGANRLVSAECHGQIPVQAWMCCYFPLEPSAFCLLLHTPYNSLISLATGHIFISLQRWHQCETRQAFLECVLLVAFEPFPSFPTAFRSIL